MKIGVFLEPDGELRGFIESLKARVAAVGDEPLLRHPPHATLYATDGDDAEPCIGVLRDALLEVAPLRVTTDDMIVFANDALAGGGDTVALAIRSSPALTALQLAVAASLAPCRKTVPLSVLPSALQRDPFASSWQRYGFPFVGPHWRPHMTIASLRSPAARALRPELLDAGGAFTIVVRQVSVWQIAGEHHQRTHDLVLGGTA